MNTSLPLPTQQQVRKGAADVLSYTFFHLVKELRSAGIEGSPKEMSQAIQSILASALFGAVAEVMSILKNEDWSSEWEESSRAWALLTVYGEQGLPRARSFAECVSARPNELAEFNLCGMNAARSLIQAVSSGVAHDEWLESHEGMFAAMARLCKVISLR